LKSLSSIWQDIKSKVNGWPLTWVLFSLLCINYVSSRLIGNEEHYLQLSKYFVDPSWVPDSFLLSDYPAPRIFFMAIAGPLIQVVGFHWAAAIGRTVLLLVMAPALVRIFREIKLSNVQWVVLFQLVLLTNQTFFGQEWIFMAFEPKTLSYAALLWALVFLIEKRWVPLSILLALATYFHILVGFGSSLAFYAVLLLSSWRTKKFWSSALLWGIMTLPFILWVKSGLTPPTGLQPTEDWIYTHYRNPHHTSPFADMSVFYKDYIVGIVLVTLLLAYLVWNYTSIKVYSQEIKQIIVLSLASSLIFLGVAYFDKEGAIMKYYPFRLQVWGVFLGLPFLFLKVFDWLESKNWGALILGLAFLSASVSLTKSFTDQFFSLNGRVPEEKQPVYRDLMHFIDDNIEQKGEVFLFYTPEKKVEKFDFTNFSRLTRQERYASFKFVPTNSEKLRIWYDRLQNKRTWYTDPRQLEEATTKEEIDYVISTSNLSEIFGSPMFSNGEYYLYKS
jgi:hypothetical protein